MLLQPIRVMDSPDTVFRLGLQSIDVHIGPGLHHSNGAKVSTVLKQYADSLRSQTDRRDRGWRDDEIVQDVGL
jgi:hypothetical protein